MRLGRICVAFLAALLLQGCYVVSTVAPKTTGFDLRLIGFWTGMEDGKPSATVLQFVEGTEKNGPRLVATNPKGVAVLELRTLTLGARHGAFAARSIMSDGDDSWPDGYVLGFYEFRGKDLWIDTMSSERVGALVDAGKVKGVKGKGQFFDVTLTGSPEEIAAFLASADARAATGDGEGSLFARRLAPPR